MNFNERQRLIQEVKDKFDINGKDIMIFDTEAYIDSDLTYHENKNIIMNQIKSLLPNNDRELVKEIKSRSEEVLQQQKEAYNEWQENNPKELKQLTKLFEKPSIIGIIGNPHEGKTNLGYFIVELLKENYDFNLCSYGLRCDLGENKIYSLEELESIRNSVIIVDEFFNLFDLEDRKNRKLIEKTLRLIFWNNNTLVLIGTPENFKKFISSKLNYVFYGRCTLGDFINGSRTKDIIVSYMGSELGSAVLELNKGNFILFDGHYQKISIPYLDRFDMKLNNPSILSSKKCANNVPNNVEKMCNDERK